jgi:MFS family permease
VSQTETTIHHRVRARLPFDVDALTTAPLRRFFLGTLLGAFGTGLTFALFVLYCVHLRHFSYLEASLLVAWEAVLGVALAPLYGTIVDRRGPSIVLTVTLPIVAVGLAAIGIASTFPEMFGVATLIAAGGAGMWSAFTVLITRIVVEEHRQDAFGINFWLINVGIGVGALVGTSIANLHDLRTFQVLYLLGALMALGDAALLFSLRRFGGPPATPEHHEQSKEGWREVMRDRRMVRMVVASLLVMVCGYGSIETGMSVFVTGVDHLSIHVVGLVIFFNTSTIIVAQLFMLRAIRGRSRSLLLGLVGLLWGGSWLLATASIFIGTAAAIVALCLGQVVFATGETIWQPVSPAVVNDLAPEHLRGRYNALIGIVWACSAAIGSLIAGVFFQLHAGPTWTVVMAGGAVLGGIGLTTMRHVLTAEEDGRAIDVASETAS